MPPHPPSPRDLLEAVFALSAALGADTTMWVLDLDEAELPQCASIDFGRDGNIVWTLPLALEAVLSCAREAVRLAGMNEDAMRRGASMPLEVAPYRCELSVPHPEDQTPWAFVAHMEPTTSEEAPPEELEARVTRIAAALPLGPAHRWSTPDAGDVASVDLDSVLAQMAERGCRFTTLWNNGWVAPDGYEDPVFMFRGGFEHLVGMLAGAGYLHSIASIHPLIVAHGMQLRFAHDDDRIEVKRVDEDLAPLPSPTRDPVGDALLDKIYEEPNNRDPQLIYADWLAEHGDQRASALIEHDVTRIPAKTWAGDIASIGTASFIKDHPRAKPPHHDHLMAVVDRSWGSTSRWSRCLRERHWQLVDTLWIQPTAPRSMTTRILREAPLSRLRHLVLPHDDLLHGLGNSPYADQLRTVSLIHCGYSPNLEGLGRALADGLFSRLRRCSVVLPGRGDEPRTERFKGFRVKGRNMMVYSVTAKKYVLVHEPTKLAPSLRLHAEEDSESSRA